MNTRSASLLCCCLAAQALGQTFTGLGVAPGDSMSQAVAISADGSTVVGHGPAVLDAGFRTVWRWQPGGQLDVITSHSIATSVSADGSVIVGAAITQPLNAPAFRWTAGAGAQTVTSVRAPGIGVSGDGAVMVGTGVSGDGVRWTEATGAMPLPNPDRGTLFDARTQSARATNFDGSAVVGIAFINFTINTGHVTPYRWTQAAGTQILTLPGGGYHQGSAFAVSHDGDTVIAGGGGVHRWRAETGLVQVPGLAMNATTALPALSGDGNTIVSIDKIWNINSGTRDITAILTEAGCDFSGWSSLVVTSVDFDGNTFCGYGTHQGLTEAWYATVPAPASLAPFATASLLTGPRRRERWRHKLIEM